MKAIFTIRVPFDTPNLNHIEYQLSQIKDYLKDDYYVLAFRDNRCEEVTFKILRINNETIEFLLSTLENTDLSLFGIKEKEFKELLNTLKQ
jgi:hypothetical protein